MSTPLPESQIPFHLLGGEAPVRAIAERFYEVMATLEPELARMHVCDEDGRVGLDAREKFALFFIGWLGGPQDYIARHGHPRLRMRHAHLPVDARMVKAWMRCMVTALDDCKVEGDVRHFLEARLGEVAALMQNR
jgi:hemoglobin